MTREGKLKRDYATYVQQANMKDPNMEKFSFNQFKTLINNLKHDYKERKVNAPSGTLLAKQVANLQFDTAHGEYIYSRKQASGIKKYIYEQEGKRVKISDIRKNELPKEFWDNISEEYGRLKMEGKSKKEAREIIATAFFNSPD